MISLNDENASTCLPCLDVNPENLELLGAEFARTVDIQHGDHTAAHILAESLEFKLCTTTTIHQRIKNGTPPNKPKSTASEQLPKHLRPMKCKLL